MISTHLETFRYFNFHVHKPSESNEGSVFFIQSYDINSQMQMVDGNSFFSIGMHPWFLKSEMIHENLAKIRAFSNHPNFLAIGEVGFDPLKSTSFELQETCFKLQADLAEEIKKPLIIHCVKSYSILLELKKKINPKMPWIVHGFRNSSKLANQLMSKGIFLSFGVSLFWEKHLQDLICTMPLNAFLIETDDSKETIDKLTSFVCKLRNITLEEFLLNQRTIYAQFFVY
jgi:TatD DNase family protein